LYTVTVTDVYDKAGNLISNPNTATFSFVGGPASLGADALPRVVGAISTGNTTVTVAFSKPMGPSAEVASNYAIVQENVNPEVGALAVASASFLTPQMDAVELTTSAQGEVTYSLHVVNVRDLSGNQLAPPELLVDPSIAVFAGSPAACRSECTNGYVDPESGNSLCVTDDDCTAEDECEPGESCEGACEPCAVPDSDGDGIPDTVEQRGWVVFIGLGNGEITLREVTSDPFSKDTDGDGLDDATELRIVSDPRLPDSDGDSLDDNTEWNVTFSSPTDQDSDDDGIDDNSEVEFFKTNANLADSDGDGFSDPEELFEMNRDPRIADLPEPRIDIGTVDLHLDEQFTFVDEVGTTTSTESSTSSSLSAERTQTSSLSIGAELGFGINAGFTGGIDGGIMNITALGNIGLELNFGVSFQSTRESSQTTSEAFETSLSKGFEITGSRSTTREITGARIDALVTLANASDVAFSLSNLEITVSAPDQVDRTSLVPVATLVPNSELINGEPAVYNLGVLNGGRGPILFSSQDVFATQVEELMRDPRGLVFEFANYDISDEFERNFAFASQMARDRTVGIVIDFGDGDGEKFLVAIAPVRNNAGDIVGGFAGFEGTGPPPSLPLEYILEEVLGLRRGVIEVVTPVWEGLSFIENDSEGAPIAADGILVGPNGVSDSIAQGDDVQRIPFGIDGLPEDAVVIDAGENGILESDNRDSNGDNTPDDVEAIITGYSTSATCGPETPSSIRPGPNGIVDTLRDPFSDDEQLVPFGTSSVAPGTDIIGPGPNGFIDTAPASDDVFVGPGIPCDDNADCVSLGACDGQETLFRFDRRTRGQFGRVWAVLLPNSDLLGIDFRKTTLRPGELLNLAFIQDLDRDGLISDVEFLFGSSDTRQDTDGDQLDDFSEIRVGWEIGVEGEPLRRVFPDPRQPDSDRDGLSDREEQDIRRVQCECIGGPDKGQACNRNEVVTAGAACTQDSDCGTGESCEDLDDDNVVETCIDGPTPEVCRYENGNDPPCGNIADIRSDGTIPACSTQITANRIDPRRSDTDGDGVTDAEEVLGWLTQAAVIDPKEVILAGADRTADSVACPLDLCSGGADHDDACRFPRDCRALKVCTGGTNKNEPCTNDIECTGPTPALSGLCEFAAKICDGGGRDGLACQETADCPGGGACEEPADASVLSGRCNRTGCDDVQVVAVGTVGLDPNTVVVAPGRLDGLDPINGGLHASTTAGGDDVFDESGDRKAETAALGDDQQIALVDDSNVLEDTPIGRVIIRPGVDGILQTHPNNDDARDGVIGLADDVLAFGQFIQSTDPLKPDTDQDQIVDGFERLLGSDPRDPADGGLLGDTDGDGLTDVQEQFAGWIARVVHQVLGVTDITVYSNPAVPDTDLDGVPDLVENLLRTDPTSQDTDGDGLSDLDEMSVEQLDEFERFNDLFPGFFLDVDASMAYGTDPLLCDTDGDFLTDDFEVLDGFTVTLPTQDGLAEVRHGFTDPTNQDTDFDGLADGEELVHDLADPPSCENDSDCRGGECVSLVCTVGATDPTDFDSDDDGRPDGTECRTDQVPGGTCTPFGSLPQLAVCDSNPLSADKKVTIRYVELTVEGGDQDGVFGLVDIGWRFQAQKSDEQFPGDWAGVVLDEATDCPGLFLDECAGGLCELNLGQDVVFNATKACDGGSNHGLACTVAGDCPNGTCARMNEHTYQLSPGEGILLNGEISEYDNCGIAICNGGLNDFEFDPLGGLLTYTACTQATINEDCLVPGTCIGGDNDGDACDIGSGGLPNDCDVTSSDCCSANGSAGCDDATCEAAVCAEDPFCCNTDWDGVCANAAIALCPLQCNPVCGDFNQGGITCEVVAPLANHITYFKTLSYETLQDGFSTDIATLSDNTEGDNVSLSLKLVVEIIVE
jgi:hypothetical protein